MDESPWRLGQEPDLFVDVATACLNRVRDPVRPHVGVGQERDGEVDDRDQEREPPTVARPRPLPGSVSRHDAGRHRMPVLVRPPRALRLAMSAGHLRSGRRPADPRSSSRAVRRPGVRPDRTRPSAASRRTGFPVARRQHGGVTHVDRRVPLVRRTEIALLRPLLATHRIASHRIASDRIGRSCALTVTAAACGGPGTLGPEERSAPVEPGRFDCGRLGSVRMLSDGMELARARGAVSRTSKTLQFRAGSTFQVIP